jgi:hypothetical protein
MHQIHLARSSLPVTPHSPLRNLSTVQMGKADLKCVDVLTSHVHKVRARMNYEHEFQGDSFKRCKQELYAD